MGQPLRMAELIAQMDGPVYVERVALYDAKQRARAAKAVEKALRLQADGVGFSFVEVLAECPTHLRATPVEAERWVKERMVPVYPLGVKKDVSSEARPWTEWSTPTFDPQKVLSAMGAGGSEAAPRFCSGFPRTAFGSDIGLKLAGAGGDGAQTAAMIITLAAVNEGFDATHIPSYGPESRGGTSYADVRLAEGEVLSADAPAPHVLVAFNAPSLAKFAQAVPPGGVVIYDSDLIPDVPAVGPSARVVGVPFSTIARSLGEPKVKNIVALGALRGATNLFPDETFLTAIRQALHAKSGALRQLNEEAFARGAAAAERDAERVGSSGSFDWWT
jgi:2-oxoisovalerate ferredoxin oxidoreductase beta subunit